MEAIDRIARHYDDERERAYLELLKIIAEGNDSWCELVTFRIEVQRAMDDGHLLVLGDDHLQLTPEGKSHLMTIPTSDAVTQMARSLETA